MQASLAGGFGGAIRRIQELEEVPLALAQLTMLRQSSRAQLTMLPQCG